MKKQILFILGMVCFFSSSNAQSWQAFHSDFASPVVWHFYAEKTGTNRYDLHITASIRPGWHLYAQKQPEDAIAVPTKITFHETGLTDFIGRPREVGKRETATIEAFGISAFQYSDKVDFIQKVKRKTARPETITGSITYQVCKEKECLPPETKKFRIGLNN